MRKAACECALTVHRPGSIIKKKKRTLIVTAKNDNLEDHQVPIDWN